MRQPLQSRSLARHRGTLALPQRWRVLVERLEKVPRGLLLGPKASAADILRVRQQMGLEDPLWDQYVGFLLGAVIGDFGVTFRYGFAVPDVANPDATGTPVLPLVPERLPDTYMLAAAAMVFACAVALVLGCLVAMYPRSALDRAINVFSLAGVSTVDLWLGFMLILLFSVQLGWLPTSGSGSL